MTPEELKAILDRVDRATPGPWKNDSGNGQVETEKWRVPICDRTGNTDRKLSVKGMYLSYTASGYPEIAHLLSYNNEDDMDFIAHARQDIPRLLDEIERLKEALRMK